MYGNMMLDLETLGKRAGCAVLSIGACMFDLGGDRVGTAFEVYISPVESLKAGLTIDPETLAWWLAPEQAEAARVVLPKAAASTVTPAQALRALFAWMESQEAAPRTALYPWSRGANFDLPIIGAMAAAVGMEVPWPFYNERCQRTMMAWYDWAAKVPKVAPATLKHSAAADADYQARALVAAHQAYYSKVSQYAVAEVTQDVTRDPPPEPVRVTKAGAVIGRAACGEG